jgi:hypothetical protein
MDSLLLLQILAPIFITAAFAAMGWLFLRSVSAELSQFQKLLLLYGCVFVFGSGYIAVFAANIYRITQSDDLVILLSLCWVGSFGYVIWRKYIR